MRYFLKNMGLAILAGLLAVAVAAPAIAGIAYTLSVVNSGSENYDAIGLAMSSNNTMLAERHYISANGLDTRVYDGATAVPHMLTDNATWFVTELDSFQSKSLVYSGGYEPLDSMYIIPGFGGYITTADNASLELGNAFEISITGYFDMAAGEDKIIAYKPGVFEIDVSSTGTVTFHAKDGGDEDVWTLQATGVSSDYHTIRVYSDGMTAYLLIDDAESATVPLLVSSYNTIQTIASVPAGFPGVCRQGFYAAGLYWQFYFGAESTVKYSTSPDGAAWSNETSLISPVYNPENFSVAWDGTYMYYARIDRNPNPDVLYFRRGIPQADSTISWSAPEQTVLTSNGLNGCDISVDASGHAYIGGQAYQSVDRSYLVRNSNTDGTWSTTIGYPMNQWSGVVQAYTCSFPGSDNMYVARSGSPLAGRFYNGSSWAGSDETIEAAAGTFLKSLVGDASGQIYALYTANNIMYLKVRSAAGSWGSALQVYAGGGSYGGSLSYDPLSGSVFIFYSHGPTGLYYKVFSEGSLSPEQTISASATLDNTNIVAYERFYEGATLVAHGRWTGNATIINGGTLSSLWSWTDTEYDYYLMLNNSVPYASEIVLKSGGNEVLRYQPVGIIQGDVLPDRAGDRQDGVFHWAIAPLNIDVTARTPKMLWWYPFIFLLIAIAGGLVYEATTARGTAEGSLLTMCIIMEAGLVLFGILGTTGTGSLIPLFPALIAPIPWSAIILSRKHVGWG